MNEDKWDQIEDDVMNERPVKNSQVEEVDTAPRYTGWKLVVRVILETVAIAMIFGIIICTFMPPLWPPGP